MLVGLIRSVPSFELGTCQFIGFSSTRGGPRVSTPAIPDARQAEEQVDSSRVGCVRASPDALRSSRDRRPVDCRATAWPAAPGPENATFRLRLPAEMSFRRRRSRRAFREFHQDSRARSQSRAAATSDSFEMLFRLVRAGRLPATANRGHCASPPAWNRSPASFDSSRSPRQTARARRPPRPARPGKPATRARSRSPAEASARPRPIRLRCCKVWPRLT